MGKGAWHFVTVPPEIGFEVRATTQGVTPKWGMVKTRVTIGDVSFETSIFPEKKTGSYDLPLKAEIRKKCRLKAGDLLRIELQILI